MKQATFLTAALALPLLLVGCRDAPPPPATSPPAPRVMATGTATIQLDKLFAVTNASDAPVAVLGPNDLSVSVRPGERLVIPLREATDGQVGLALASVSAAGEVTLNGTSVRVGSEVVWGRLTSTPPAGDNLMERTFRGEADTIPASLRAVLADRLVAVPVTVGVPQSWPDFRVGSVTEGVRVERVGLLSVIHTDGCYCINEAGMLMRWIPPGSFVQAARGRGGAGRSITLTKGFWMGCTEVTRGQAALALGRSVPSGSEMPHGGLSWFEA
ncbi:MAG TPA: hypothetical protein VFF65_09090, partial [Phycisphaerales bacterium]|nr:hypothetical protein [Phycisphaerales bacterium]